MRKYIKIIILLLLPVLGMAQPDHLENLRSALKIAHTDSARFVALYGIGDYYLESNTDSALLYFNRAYVIAKASRQTLDEAIALAGKGHELMHLGKFPESYESLQLAFSLLEKPGGVDSWYRTQNFKHDQMRRWILVNTYGITGILMNVTNNKAEEIIQYKKSYCNCHPTE